MKHIIRMMMFFLLFSVMLRQTATAADTRLPTRLLVSIVMKVLTYDKNLVQRCPLGLIVGVVSLSGNKESMNEGEDLVNELEANSLNTVKGLSISVESLGITNISDLRRKVEKEDINILFLGPALEPMISDILKLAYSNKILVVTGEPNYVQAGVAIGVVQRNRKPKIQVNANSAFAQGAKMDARLLQLAEKIQ
jgi:hypothetical protein